MKLEKSIVLLLIGFLFLSSSALAAQDGDYTYIESSGNATITDYTGTGGDISIPAALGGFPTVAIGDSAFFQNTTLTSVTFPISLVSIGNDAFEGCTGLTIVTIPSSVTTIGIDAFRLCTSATSLTIPEGVTTIGNRAFARMYSLTDVSIPASVTSIGTYGFFGGTSNTGITVHADNPNYSSQDGVLYNKDKTLLIQYPCGKAGAFTTPASVASIGIAAFELCDVVTSVTFTGSVTSIAEAGFGSCTGLTSITFPSSLTSIVRWAFDGCASLTSAYFYGNAPTMGIQVFDNCASGFTVYYLAGATGFTNPWYGYPTAVFTPPPTCAGVAPASATQGATMDVTITGLNTNFEDGLTAVSFMCAGTTSYITVNSTQVNSETETIANITIEPGATVGACDVTVTTGAEIVTCPAAFAIVPTCAGVAPASAARGATLDVTITGVETNFEDGLTAVSFMCAGTTSYITVNGTPTVNSPTQTVANITIASNAPLGACDVIATTNLETITCTGAFTINAASTTTTTSGGGGGGGGGGNSTTTTTPAVTTTTVPATTTTVPATTTTTAAITTTTTTALTECQIKSIQPSGIKIGFGLLPRIRRVTLTLNTDLESLGITCADLNIQNAPRGIRIISCAVAGDTIEATILFWGIQPGTYNINLGQGQCGSIPFIVSRF